MYNEVCCNDVYLELTIFMSWGKPVLTSVIDRGDWVLWTTLLTYEKITKQNWRESYRNLS